MADERKTIVVPDGINDTPEEVAAFFATQGINVDDPTYNETGEAELSDEELESVAGGMGYFEAVKIISVSYYEALRRKKPTYSMKKVKQAAKKLQEGCYSGMVLAVKKYLGL